MSWEPSGNQASGSHSPNQQTPPGTMPHGYYQQPEALPQNPYLAAYTQPPVYVMPFPYPAFPPVAFGPQGFIPSINNPYGPHRGGNQVNRGNRGRGSRNNTKRGGRGHQQGVSQNTNVNYTQQNDYHNTDTSASNQKRKNNRNEGDNQDHRGHQQGNNRGNRKWNNRGGRHSANYRGNKRYPGQNKRNRPWEGNNNQSNKRSSRVLYDASWLEDPWAECRQNNAELLQKYSDGRVLYDSSWLKDPWETLQADLSGILYDESWLENPWCDLETKQKKKKTTPINNTDKETQSSMEQGLSSEIIDDSMDFDTPT